MSPTIKKIWHLKFFFPPTRHKNLCQDPSPIEYAENGVMYTYKRFDNSNGYKEMGTRKHNLKFIYYIFVKWIAMRYLYTTSSATSLTLSASVNVVVTGNSPTFQGSNWGSCQGRQRWFHSWSHGKWIIKWTILLSPPVQLHGGLIGIAFCLSVCLSVRLSVCPWLDRNSWTIIHISGTIWVRVTKFGMVMEIDDI